MREVRVTVSDEEYKFLTKIKNQAFCKSWHNFLILAAKSLADEKEDEE
ncbi:hypothetical protein LCGC14_1271910 [marine sediment metagenome]|uniref:Uncharacterized protein n=1 Tax=marine sediment metagenome TaxID=412755 RepID=A0A0F9NEH1_9ZZZZ